MRPFFQESLQSTDSIQGWVFSASIGILYLHQQKGLSSLAQPNIEEVEPTPQEILLAEIMQRLDEAGDLPIFSSSVNRVQVVGSDPDADAVALATEVLKDANLTTKILKLANSSFYSRGGSKIGALSRAIVVLGFDLLKTTVLTMKLIDSFQERRSDSNIERMLVKAYMSAGFVKEMAEVVGAKNSEQSYICGLLHNLGEIIVASVMPEKYQEMQSLVESKESTWSKAQKAVLGMSLREVGRLVVKKWEFPDSVSNTMTPPKAKPKGKITDHIELNRSLSSLTNDMMDLIYSDSPMATRSFTELTKELVTVTGANKEMVSASLDKALKQSCDLAENYGLDKKHLRPNTSTAGSEDKLRDQMIKSLTAHIDPIEDDTYDSDPDDFDEYGNEPIESFEVNKNVEEINNNIGLADATALLTIIQQITAYISQKAPLNSVFGKVLEGMTQGVGFDRATLCLMSPDRKSYSSRIAVGNKSEQIRELFSNRNLDVRHDLFSKVIIDGGEILVHDINAREWAELLTPDDIHTLGSSQFLIASMQVQGKPVGLFYGDKVIQQTDITSEDFRGFLQLVAQAQLALQVR